MGLQETFDRFLADMKLEGKADMTLVEYANRLSRFKKYLIRHKKALNEVKHDDIVEFTREMFKNNLNSTTIKCELSTLYVYSLWAVKNDKKALNEVKHDDIVEFTREMFKNNLNSTTIKCELSTLYVYSLWAVKNGKKALNEVKHDDIVEFTREMFKNNLNSTTIKCELSTLYVYSLWAVKNGILNHVFLSPADYPKTNTTKKRIRRLSDENIRAFIAYIDSLQENIRAAFWLMYGTGARVGEIAHLMATDVQLKGRAVYINIRDAKWGSDRCVPILDKQAAKIVWQYWQSVGPSKQPLFRVSRRTLQWYATKFAQDTGIEFHCHLLRHTFAARLTEKGVPITQPLFRVSRRTLQWYATKFAQDTGIEFHCHLLRHTFAARLTEKGVPITTIQYLLGHRTVAMTAYYAQSALVDMTSITPTI